MDIVELIMSMEDQFKITNEAENITTVGRCNLLKTTGKRIKVFSLS